MTRTFIALEMDESLQRHLRNINHRMAQELPNLRWVDPAGIHLTLAFLGELTDEQVAKAIESAEDAARQISPFEYRLSGLGIFGSPRQPRVVWMGIEETSGKLIKLHRALNRELRQRRFEVEKRPFSPHLTLARVKTPLTPDEQQRLQHLLTNQQAFSSSSLHQVRFLSVMKSELSRTGAKYTCLQNCPLQGVVSDLSS